MTTTTRTDAPDARPPAYREEFEIGEDWDLTDEGERGFIGFRCNTCERDVTDRPCPEHAPHGVPGLRRADCWATPPHSPVWEVDRDDYGLPCPHCRHAAALAELGGHRRCRHWAWRRWPVTAWLVHILRDRLRLPVATAIAEREPVGGKEGRR